MFAQIKLSPKLITLITFFSIVFPIGVFASQAQAAETFTVDGNMALNTNNNFTRIDGQPRMSIYTRNDSDPDQQFDRINGNRGGTLLKHRSTGNCLNAHYVSDGGSVNVWPCDANDVDQNFVLSDAGNGYVQIKRAGTNKCVDSPTRSNQEKVHLWECVGNANQRWKSSATPSVTSWKLPWRGGVQVRVSQGWHYDGWNQNNNALDFSIPAGATVLAPFDSTVTNFCNAGNNHLAIQLKSTDGRIYSLIHVNSSSVFKGRTFKQGEQVGTVAGDTPNNSCAVSTGPNLHMGLPSQNFTMDNYNFTPNSIPQSLTSRNN